MPDILYHGIARKSLPTVMTEGIRLANGQPIPLSSDREGAMLPDIDDPFIVIVNTFRLNEDSIQPVPSSFNRWTVTTLPLHCLEFDGWHCTPDQVIASDMAQLRNEVGSTHALYPDLEYLESIWTLTPAADDRLFRNRQSGSVHLVHLTFSGTAALSSDYPLTETYLTFEEWVAENF